MTKEEIVNFLLTARTGGVDLTEEQVWKILKKGVYKVSVPLEGRDVTGIDLGNKPEYSESFSQVMKQIEEMSDTEKFKTHYKFTVELSDVELSLSDSSVYPSVAAIARYLRNVAKNRSLGYMEFHLLYACSKKVMDRRHCDDEFNEYKNYCETGSCFLTSGVVAVKGVMQENPTVISQGEIVGIFYSFLGNIEISYQNYLNMGRVVDGLIKECLNRCSNNVV